MALITAMSSSDFIAGQIDTQRTAILALFLQMPDKAGALAAFRQLHKRLQEDLLGRTVSDAQLEGLAAEARSLEELFEKCLSTPSSPIRGKTQGSSVSNGT
jgi:hypothetical protein